MHNDFADIGSVVGVLELLPLLETLEINLAAKEEVALVLSSLPGLKALNGQRMARVTVGVDEESESECSFKESIEVREGLRLRAQDLEGVIRVYETVCEHKRCEKDEEQLNAKLTKIAAVLKEALNDEVSLCLRNAAVLKAKGELLGMAFEKLGGEGDDAKLWRVVKAEYEAVVRDCLRNMECHKLKESEAKIKELTETIKDLEEEIRTGNDEREKLQKKLDQRQHVKPEPHIKYEPAPKPAAESPPQDLKPHFAVGSKSYPTAKFMSLKQLKDTIADIYQQKTRYDEKAAENRQSRETMEQYMHTYLNQIYGLKSLTVEGVGGIMKGIKKYWAIDSEVALFGKILSNECDEDFRFVFTEVKIAMENILREKLKSRYRLKTETELNRMVHEIQQGTISRSYWSAIITKMYNEEHSEILNKKIREKVELDRKLIKTSGRKSSSERCKANSDILYSDLQKIILDFQLTTHESYILKFTRVFKEVDGDRNGVVDEAEFRQLVAKMRVPTNEENVQALLQAIDPYDNQKISYSECISLFSSVR